MEDNQEDYDYYTMEDLETDLKDEVPAKAEKVEVLFADGPSGSFYFLSTSYDKDANTLWLNLKEDGKIGEHTIEDLQKALKDETGKGSATIVRFTIDSGKTPCHLLSAYYVEEENIFFFDIEEDGVEDDEDSPNNLNNIASGTSGGPGGQDVAL